MNWWNERLPLKKSLLVFVVSITLIGFIALPVQITVDSIFYISSAKSLFSPEFAELYVWYREPGYPLFLRLIHLFGDSAQYVLLVQSFFIAVSFAVLIYVFSRATKLAIKRWQLVLIFLLAINPMFFQYAGSFLQQASFCLILAMYALAIEWARELPSKLSLTKYLVLLLLLYVLSISTSIGWIYFGFFPIFVSVFYLTRNKFAAHKLISQKSHLGKFIFWIGITILVSTAALFLGRGVYGLWESYKAPYAAQVDYKTYVVKPLSGLPPVKDPVYIGERMLALMDIGHVSPYEPQNEIFLGASLSLGDPKSDYDGAYINLPFSDYAFDYFTVSNPSIIGHSLISLFSPVSPWVYRGVFALSGIGILIFAFKRKWMLIALSFIPISFSFIHAYNGTPVDRYGIPTYPFAVVILIWSLGMLPTMKKQGLAND